MLASNDWFEQIKYHVQQVIEQKNYVLEGTVTSRQLNPPSVKVMLQPYNIETGWLPVGTPYAGAGYGFLAIPPESQAVKVIFDMGNLSSPTVVCNVYNDIDIPPTLNNIDDVVLIHQSGSQLYFAQNGDMTIKAIGNLNLSGKTSSQTL